METKLIITPKTKVYDLLAAYPELEELLIATIPTFNKLKNPVLRNTVAKITTLQQAAPIGNIKTEELINLLRKAVGQEKMEAIQDTGFVTVQPSWFSEDKVVRTFDVREMLEAGEHPVNQVLADVKALKEGEIYSMIAPFLPAPLIEKAASLNARHWVDQVDEECFYIYFCK
ncbi:MAG: hypothetical protein BGP01_04115 [Paludibacter sp. 47-17]|jgi:hypothetical protein|nr:MAG: hypothetical protein BGP01_04115 [Paludibacter sp. 47-17]